MENLFYFDDEALKIMLSYAELQTLAILDFSASFSKLRRDSLISLKC
jgi:hypothetical protein